MNHIEILFSTLKIFNPGPGTAIMIPSRKVGSVFLSLGLFWIEQELLIPQHLTLCWEGSGSAVHGGEQCPWSPTTGVQMAVPHPQSPRVLYVTPAPRFFICKMDLKWHARACVCMLSCFSCVQHFVTLWTMPRQVPLSMRFSRHEY